MLACDVVNKVPTQRGRAYDMNYTQSGSIATLLDTGYSERVMKREREREGEHIEIGRVDERKIGR